MAKDKVVLAYSGGLDTSIMITWLIETYHCEVIAVCAHLGQDSELEGLEEKALKTGASKVYIEDLRERFITDYIYPTLKASAMYEGKYLLGTSFGRPLIAKRQVEIAEQEGATMVAHGATGKGNDQVRFELTYMALNPDLKIISPWKDEKWTLHSRDACEAYAAERGIPLRKRSDQKLYSEDANIWHISHEGLELEDPGKEPLDAVYTFSNTLSKTPDQAEYVEIEFEKGIPVSVNGKRLSPIELLTFLNQIGGKHGVGQIDIIENRLVGIKSRGVYETPGGTILFEAHRVLESLVLERDLMQHKEKLSIDYAKLVYDGRWFSPLRDALDRYFDETQKTVTGKVRMSLFKGHVRPAGVWSPHSLYLHDLASFTDSEFYNQQDATGFIRLFGLPMKVNGMVNRRNG